MKMEQWDPHPHFHLNFLLSFLTLSLMPMPIHSAMDLVEAGYCLPSYSESQAVNSALLEIFLSFVVVVVVVVVDVGNVVV